MTAVNTSAEEQQQYQTPDTTATLPDRLRAVLEQEPNKVCAECPEPEPTWACLLSNPLDNKDGEGGPIFMGVLCCYRCYGGHFQLGEDVGQVKSTRRADQWTEEEIHVLELTGNHTVNEIYEAKLTPETKKEQYEQDKDAFVTDKYKALKYFSKKRFQQHLKWRKKCADAKEATTKESTTSGRKTFKLPGRSKSSREGPKKTPSSDGPTKGRRALQATVKTLTAAAHIAAKPAANITAPSFDWGSFSKGTQGSAKHAATDEKPETGLGASLSEHGTASSRKSNSLDMSLLKEIADELEDNQQLENKNMEDDSTGTQEQGVPGPHEAVSRSASSAGRAPRRVARRGVRQSKSSPQTLLSMVGGSETARNRRSSPSSDDEEDPLPQDPTRRERQDESCRYRRKPTPNRTIKVEDESDSGKVLKSRSSSRRGTGSKGGEEGMGDHSGRSLKKRSSHRRRIRETTTSDEKATKRTPRHHRTPRRAQSNSGDVMPAHRSRSPRRAHSESADVIRQRIRGQTFPKKNAATEPASQPTETCPSPTRRDESTHSKLSLSESLSRHLNVEASILNGSSLSIGSAKTDLRSWGSSSLAGSEGGLSLSPRRSSDGSLGSLDLSFAIDSTDDGVPRVPFLSSIDDIVVEKRPNTHCPNGSNSLLDLGLSCPDSPSSTASNSSSDLISIPGCNAPCNNQKQIEKCNDRSLHSKRSKGKDPARSSKHESTPSCPHSSARRKHRSHKNGQRNPMDEETTIEATILALKAINKTSVVVNPTTQKLAFHQSKQGKPSSSPNLGMLMSRKSGNKMTSTGRLSSDPLSLSSDHGPGQKNYQWSKPSQSKINTSNVRNQLLISAVDPLLTG